MKINYNRILLICIDSLGKDYSSHLKKFFNVEYLNYRTTNTWTLPSHVGMLSGYYLPELYFKLVQVHDIERYKDYVKGVPTIATLLKKNGYKTKAITGGGFMSRYFGWGHDWDEWNDPVSTGREWNGEEVILEKNEFLFLHTFYIHNWFDETQELRKIFRENRKKDDTSSKFSDDVIKKAKRAYISRINKFSRKLSWLSKLQSNTLIILTSDHAELFKEDGESFHHGHYAMKNGKIFEVPLLIKDGTKQRIVREFTYDLSLIEIIKNRLKIKDDNNLQVNFQISKELVNLQQEYSVLKKDLNQILSSKFYRLWQAYCNIKRRITGK